MDYNFLKFFTSYPGSSVTELFTEYRVVCATQRSLDLLMKATTLSYIEET